MLRNRWVKFFLIGLALLISACLLYLYLSPQSVKQAGILFHSHEGGDAHQHSPDHDHHSMGHDHDHEVNVELLPEKFAGLPEAGSYELHRIQKAASYDVLDSQGKIVPLEQFIKDKYTLLTFFYESCSDANGCPLAMTVMHTLKSYLKKDPELASHVRFVSLSFDPIRDTPVMMAELEQRMGGGDKDDANVKWYFLTTQDVDHLMPLINSYGQNVEIVIDTKTGEQTMQYQHVLKMFLIDQEGFVREIYSSLDLSPEVLLNDIHTLEIADRSRKK